MALEISMKEKEQEKNYYFDEFLEWYESRQALQEQNDALENKLLSQKRSSEAKIAGIVKAEKEEWEKEAQARIQCAVGNAIQRTIHGCNELLLPHRSSLDRRLVERKHEVTDSKTQNLFNPSDVF